MPSRRQLRLEFQVVLHDPVVDHSHVARAVGMGVSIDVAGLAVGGPASVAYAFVSIGPTVGDGRGQRLQLADSLVDGEAAVLSKDGDACAVIATVLQPAQPIDEDRACGAGTHVSHDSTHRPSPLTV